MGQAELAGVHGVVPSTKLGVPMARLGGRGQPLQPCCGTKALLQGGSGWGSLGCTPPWPGLTGAGGC